jgi:hypothetical protein
MELCFYRGKVRSIKEWTNEGKLCGMEEHGTGRFIVVFGNDEDAYASDCLIISDLIFEVRYFVATLRLKLTHFLRFNRPSKLSPDKPDRSGRL